MNVMPLAAARVITRARTLLSSYDLIICDVWGVLHDGQSAYTAAGDALARARDGAFDSSTTVAPPYQMISAAASALTVSIAG